MSRAIFISIKPKFTSKIEAGEKNYEYRNYIPNEDFDTLYVYETNPTSALKYILHIDKIVKYPTKILEDGFGNEEFNQGLKKSKYAYHIANVYKLDKPIPLEELRKKYGFFAPQSYAYDKKYLDLVDYIKNAKVEKII